MGDVSTDVTPGAPVRYVDTSSNSSIAVRKSSGKLKASKETIAPPDHLPSRNLTWKITHL